MSFRKLLFWLHLIAGSVAGIIILIMSVTGALLMYEKQIIAMAERGDYQRPFAGARLAPEDVLGKVRDARQQLPSSITFRSDPAEPVELGYGLRPVYADPTTGALLGEAPTGVRAFFRSVTDWHRWLGVPGEGRTTARAITGACNLAFLMLLVSGLYLWLPKYWSMQHLRPILWFRAGLSGKARDFNWHNVFGFWCAVPLFFVVLGATVISYPWASNLAYRLAGSEPPPAAAKKGEPKGDVGKKGRKGEKGERGGPPGVAAPPVDLDLAGINAAFSAAQQRVPGWKSITLRLPGSSRAPWTLTIDEGYAGQPQLRTNLTVTREGEQRWEAFSSFDSGRRFRTWLRFVHTGEYYGLIGQTIAGIASAAGAFLVWTGIALALRRYAAWRKRTTPRTPAAEPVSA